MLQGQCICNTPYSNSNTYLPDIISVLLPSKAAATAPKGSLPPTPTYSYSHDHYDHPTSLSTHAPSGLVKPTISNLAFPTIAAMNGHLAGVGEQPTPAHFEHGVQVVDEDKQFK